MTVLEIIERFNSFSFIIIVIILITVDLSYSQQNSIIDVLPLSIGNKWLYNYEAISYSSVGHSSSSESGTMEYEVIGKDITTEGNLWHFIQRRDALSNVYGIGTIIKKDSAKFDLMELNNTFHEIYSISFNEFSVFPFQKSNIDSSKYFRYKETTTITDIPLKIEYPDPDNPMSYMNYKYNFILRNDIGILQLDYNKSGMLSGKSSKYYLKKYNQTIISSVEAEQINNFEPRLMQNYPNPFNNVTKIRFYVSKRSRVIIKIYDIVGKEVSTLVNKQLIPGEYEEEFDGNILASGVYLYQIQVDNFIQNKKMILLK